MTFFAAALYIIRLFLSPSFDPNSPEDSFSDSEEDEHSAEHPDGSKTCARVKIPFRFLENVMGSWGIFNLSQNFYWSSARF